MTDFSDACFGCGGHLRGNVWSGDYCPECERKRENERTERDLRFTMIDLERKARET